MSDFFSLTVTVRAPRPSFSRRACACSPIEPAASRSWSRVVRSSGKVDSALICLAGAFSATGRSSMPRASWCSAGPTVRAEDVGGLGVGQRGERADGFDAEPVQLLLGDRADPPQPPNRQTVAAARVPRRGAPPGCRRVWPAPRRSWRSACRIRRRRRRRARSRRGSWPAAPRQNASTSVRRSPRRVRRARRTPRRRTAARGRAQRCGRCRARGGWPRRRRRRAAATPRRWRRPGGGPDASASPIARRTPGTRSWRRRPRRVRPARRRAPGGRAASAGSAARPTRRTRPCRSAAPSERPQSADARALAWRP